MIIQASQITKGQRIRVRQPNNQSSAKVMVVEEVRPYDFKKPLVVGLMIDGNWMEFATESMIEVLG